MFSTLIAIIYAEREPYPSIVKYGQLDTWVNTFYPRNQIVYFHGIRPNQFTISLDNFIEKMRWHSGRTKAYALAYVSMILFWPFRWFIPKFSKKSSGSLPKECSSIRINIPEMYVTMRWKILAVLKHFVDDTQHEFIVITTPSAYIKVDLMNSFLANLIEKNIYAGPINELTHDSKFASTSALILNRNSAQLLLDNRKLIPSHVLVDVGFGYAFRALSVSPIAIPSLNIDNLEFLNKLTKHQIDSNFHFRLKSGSNEDRKDSTIFHFLHKKIKLNN